jgi:Zn-dependent protease
VVIAVLSGFALFVGVGAPGVVAFFFVLAVWVITLCLHEFFHALVAFRNGDESVAYRGYLTLDPLRYTHPIFSIVLPLVFVLLGGIGLPGGAVFIDHSALRTRGARSRVSAAGPLTNLAIAVVVAIAILLGARTTGTIDFWAALAFLLFLQITATVLNLLPVPGLDGFGIIEPYLRPAWVARAMRVAPFAILILFGLLWIPVVNGAFFGAILGITDAMGVQRGLIGAGYSLFQFWR